jgi:sugar/nucleoside kinase (ribokinase family)
MKKICTLGSATQDIFILYEGAETLHLQLKKSVRSFLLFEQGTKVDVPKLHYATGGGATNAAVGLKRMGFDVEAFFKTGTDDAGTYVRQEMVKEQVNIDHCPVDLSVNTALTFIIPSLEKNHVALCYRAANKHLRVEDFPFDILKQLDYVYLSAFSGPSRALYAEVIERARSLAVPIASNPGIGQLSHDPEKFIDTLRSLDVLMVNLFEAEHLMKMLVEQKKSSIAVNRENAFPLEPTLFFNDQSCSLRDFFSSVLNLGPRTVVLTHGARGVYVGHEDMLYFCQSLHAQVVSALGAGDAFGSAFVGALLLNKALEEAMLYGALNAKSVIEHADAKEGLLSLKALEDQLKTVDIQVLKKQL